MIFGGYIQEPATDVSVIVCTHDRADDLAQVLRDLALQERLTGLRWEIVVVDNASTDATADIVRQFGAGAPMPVRYLYEGRIGKAHALNAAIANVAADILAFTDDDVRIGPEWLILLVEAITNSGCIGAGGPVVPVWHSRKPRWVSDTEPCRMQAAIVEFHHDGGTTMREAAPLGANAALRREAFQRYGMYRTDLGHVGRTPLPAEDTEFIRRLYAAGEALCYAPAAIVHHPVDPRRLTRRYFLDWYIARGRVEMLEHVGDDGPRLLGVPHHVIRRAVESMARWLVSLRPSVRFYHKLMVYRWIGAMQQSFAIQRSDVGSEPDRRR